jgi:ABC-type nitrate/sulfonate/bicarbonate transport system permease component
MSTATTAVLGRKARPARRMLSSRARVSTVSVVIVLGTWQLLGSIGAIPVDFTSTPIDIVKAGWELAVSGELGAASVSTLRVFLIGTTLGVVVGVPLGMLMGWKLPIRQTLDPLISALYVTPSIVLLPIFVLALGASDASKIAIVFIEVVITVIINSMAGIREADPRLLRVAKAFQASESQLFRLVLFRSALPTIIAGIRLGTGRGIVTAIVAELYGGVSGIGVLIAVYGASLQVSQLMFLVILVGAFGYLLSTLLRELEIKSTPWKRS